MNPGECEKRNGSQQADENIDEDTGRIAYYLGGQLYGHVGLSLTFRFGDKSGRRRNGRRKLPTQVTAG